MPPPASTGPNTDGPSPEGLIKPVLRITCILIKLRPAGTGNWVEEKDKLHGENCVSDLIIKPLDSPDCHLQADIVWLRNARPIMTFCCQPDLRLYKERSQDNFV